MNPLPESATSAALLSHQVPPGAAWSVLLRAGRAITLTALGKNANVSTLIYAAGHPVDRMNIPDTLKAQMSACIHAPMVLMTDRGLGLMSVTASSLDWHDALGGHSTDDHVERFGPSSYAANRNDWHLSARAGLLSELRKHGRGEADLHACINFFSKVGIGDDPTGPLALVTDHCAEGDFVTLRAELDVLLVFATAPHPLAAAWNPAGVGVTVTEAAPVGEDDPSRTFRPESARALAQTGQVYA